MLACGSTILTQHSPTRLFWGCCRCPPIKLPAPALLAHPLARCGQGNVAGLGHPDPAWGQQSPLVELHRPPGMGRDTRLGARKGGCSGCEPLAGGHSPGVGARTRVHTHTPVGRPVSAHPWADTRGGKDGRTASCVLKLDLPLPAGPLSALKLPGRAPSQWDRTQWYPRLPPEPVLGDKASMSPTWALGGGTGDGGCVIWTTWVDNPHPVPLVGTLSPCPRLILHPLGNCHGQGGPGKAHGLSLGCCPPAYASVSPVPGGVGAVR